MSTILSETAVHAHKKCKNRSDSFGVHRELKHDPKIIYKRFNNIYNIEKQNNTKNCKITLLK